MAKLPRAAGSASTARIVNAASTLRRLPTSVACRERLTTRGAMWRRTRCSAIASPIASPNSVNVTGEERPWKRSSASDVTILSALRSRGMEDAVVNQRSGLTME